MRILISTAQTPFVRGGAEILAEELQAALETRGHEVDLCSIPFKWYPAQSVADHMASCRLLDLSDFNGTPVDRVIGLKFPAYLARHPHKTLWLVHQHREAYDLWDRKIGALYAAQEGAAVRDLVTEADKSVLGGEYLKRYTISRNVSRRLEKYCGVTSEALYHPPRHSERFKCEESESFLFFPSRLTQIKRQSLAIEALALTKKSSVKLVFAGVADSSAYLKTLQDMCDRLGVSDRVEFLGYVSDEEKVDLYSRCMAVVYPPLDEDYGYVTLEAMLSRKPVLSASDSGGVLEFMRDGTTGRVCEPDAESLAEGMDELVSKPRRAAQWGEDARDLYESMDISWDSVVEALTQ